MSDWRDDAACAQPDCDVEPDEWFPSDADYNLARKCVQRICDACPVRVDCLDFALTTGQDHGIWAATTPRDRRVLIGRRRKADEVAQALAALRAERAS